MEKLGVEPVQLLTQILNFTLMVFILSRFLYKPIIGKLKERRQKIEEGLTLTEKVKLELEEIEKKKQEILGYAKEEARKIVEEGRKAGKDFRTRILGEAHQEAAAILEKGKKELGRERLELERQLRGQTVKVAQSMTKRLLEESLTLTDQQRIIDKKIEKISKLIR